TKLDVSSSNSALYPMEIDDISLLSDMHRLSEFSIFGNSQIYDISVSFRSLSMNYLQISGSSSFLPLCRSESDTDYWTFITSVFPLHDADTTNMNTYYLPNSCPLNSGYYYCDPNTNSSCPSIVLNEVYNSTAETPAKECAFIAKEGSDGECYTIHDDSIRNYLQYYCLDYTNIESNGIISLATLRNKLTCSSFYLYDITSSVDSITTLKGLEYCSSLLTLNIDGYDLSGDTNSNSEYDRLVIQILAKAVTYSNSYDSVYSGLTTLSASGCNLSAVSDVLDLTLIADGDSATQPFKLTSLDLSNNSISDVSVLITSGLFPADTLTFLDISGNSICDIDAAVTTLQSYFTNTVAIVSSGQSTCPCSDSGSTVLFSSHKTCRQRSDGEYQVECWDGYYLDLNTNECIPACDTNYLFDSNSCVPSTVAVNNDIVRCQVCERKPDYQAVVTAEGEVVCSTSCSSGYFGNNCDELCPVAYDSNTLCNGVYGSC
ncbi:hypothetical protein ADUPG1_000606, partial [Aduncisulcus paluster]